ncbi:post-transcriptional regulator [Caldalkalibacillus salinus]|uniref:post-transcriptional regulator n=1 Tax=Caldalkalibacillus salinus TaxID=2803787 RepID=UPI001924DD3F|nr:post-transcriptional regulator [Caldalkalibacillus salinus]
MNAQQWNILRERVDTVLRGKAEELHLLGYDAVTTDDIWACVTSKYKREWPMFHQIVNDIYTLKPAILMNWLTTQAYKGEIDIGKSKLL